MKKKSIPIHLRESVICRDKWACQVCGKVADVGLTNKRGVFQVFEINPDFIDLGRVANQIGDGQYISFEIDHIIPELKGGPMVLENLRLLCRRCNRKKGDRT